jgi:hypothetical protein
MNNLAIFIAVISWYIILSICQMTYMYEMGSLVTLFALCTVLMLSARLSVGQ